MTIQAYANKGVLKQITSAYRAYKTATATPCKNPLMCNIALSTPGTHDTCQRCQNARAKLTDLLNILDHALRYQDGVDGK